jgi:hypothetical protein
VSASVYIAFDFTFSARRNAAYELSLPLRMRLSMDQHEPIALEYATRQSLRPPAEALWRTTQFVVGITGSVGVAILILFAISGLEAFALLGFLWLFVGAMSTAIAFVCGLTYAATALARGFPTPATRRRSVWAVLLPILNVALAIVCAIAGQALDSWYHPHMFDD